MQNFGDGAPGPVDGVHVSGRSADPLQLFASTRSKDDGKIVVVMSYRGRDNRLAYKIQKYLHGYRIPKFDEDGCRIRGGDRRLEIRRDKTDLTDNGETERRLAILLSEADALLLVCTPQLVAGPSEGDTDWAQWEYEQWKMAEDRGIKPQARLHLLWASGRRWDSACPNWLFESDKGGGRLDYCKDRRRARFSLAASLAELKHDELGKLWSWHAERQRRTWLIAFSTVLAVMCVIAWLGWQAKVLSTRLESEFVRAHGLSSQIFDASLRKLNLLHGSRRAVEEILAVTSQNLGELERTALSDDRQESIFRDSVVTRLLVCQVQNDAGSDIECMDGLRSLEHRIDRAASIWPAATWPAVIEVQAAVLSGRASLRLLRTEDATAYEAKARRGLDRMHAEDALRQHLLVLIGDLTAWNKIAVSNWKEALNSWSDALELLRRLPPLESSQEALLPTYPGKESLKISFLRMMADIELLMFYEGDGKAFHRANAHLDEILDLIPTRHGVINIDRPSLVELCEALWLRARLGEVLAAKMKELGPPPQVSPAEGEASRQKCLRSAMEVSLQAVEAARSLVLLNQDAPGYNRELVKARMLSGRLARDINMYDAAREHLQAAIKIADDMHSLPGLAELKGSRFTARLILARSERDRWRALSDKRRTDVLELIVELINEMEQLSEDKSGVMLGPDARSEMEAMRILRSEVKGELKRISGG
jgi:tetratricopeptide (TPR) repeat protein